MTPEPASGSGVPDDDTLRSLRDATVPRVPGAETAAGEATVLDTDPTDDPTIRVRRAYAPPPVPTTGEEADGGGDAHAAAGAGGRIASRPDAVASAEPSPIRTPAPVVAARAEPSPAAPQGPIDGRAVGHDIRSKGARRVLILVLVVVAVMAGAAALLATLVSGVG